MMRVRTTSNGTSLLVQVEESFKGLPPENNPYYATKAQFLKLGIPVQSVRLETMETPDTQLVYAMNHMSLATYAKLGGTPWLLAAQQRVAHELVIGLGSHTTSASRIGSRPTLRRDYDGVFERWQLSPERPHFGGAL